MHAFAWLFLSNRTAPMTSCTHNTLSRAMVCPNSMSYGLSAIVSFDLCALLKSSCSVELKEIYGGRFASRVQGFEGQ